MAPETSWPRLRSLFSGDNWASQSGTDYDANHDVFTFRSLLFDPEFVHLLGHGRSGRRSSVAAIGRVDVSADFF